MGKDGFAVRVQAERGKDLPDWYMNEPPALPGDQFYLEAFDELSSCRQIGMSVGPIPYDKIVWYSREILGFDEDSTSVFKSIIRELDNVYLKWAADQNKPKGQK